MEYIRIDSIDHPMFARLHRLLGEVFPPEEVLAYELWREPLRDAGIHVYVAVHEGEVVGATEYRYYADMRVAMTDFTIVGKPDLAVGRFLFMEREKDLARLQRESGTESLGMFAEIYDPRHVAAPSGPVTQMHPAVRREVLSHQGYRRLQLAYVHPSWDHEGKAVTGLDLCFRPADESLASLPAGLIARFLRTYYAALPNKPGEWTDMVESLDRSANVALLPL